MRKLISKPIILFVFTLLIFNSCSNEENEVLEPENSI